MRKMILSCIDWTIQRLIDLRYILSPNLNTYDCDQNVYCRDFDPTYDSHLIDKIAENVEETQNKCDGQLSGDFVAQHKYGQNVKCCEDFYDEVEDPPIKDCDIKIEVKKKDYVEPPQDWHGLKPEKDKWI